MSLLNILHGKQQSKTVPPAFAERLANLPATLKAPPPAATGTPRTLTIGLYMRYSSNKQDPFSFDRQMAKAQEYAEKIGGQIVVVYADDGESGAFTVNRPQFRAAIDAGEARQFDVLLLENGDRMSRKLHITATAFARVTQVGVEVHSTNEGRWSLMHAALSGLMSEEFRNRFSELVRSGIVKLVSRNLWPGKAPYGYEKIKDSPGDMRVLDKEADTVKRMFEMRAEGVPNDSIAQVLNGQEIRTKEGNEWSGVTVGNVLSNTLYLGCGTYFKTRQQRKEIGERIAWCCEKRSVDQWMYVERPDWAILKSSKELALWDEAQRRRLSHPGHSGPHRRALLSRHMVCGSCGAALVIDGLRADGTLTIKCQGAQRRRAGTGTLVRCRQSVVPLIDVERAAIGLVCDRLSRPHAKKNMMLAFEKKANAEVKTMEAERVRLQRDRVDLRKRLDLTYDGAMVIGMTTKVLAEQRQGFCRQIDEIDLRLASLPVVHMAPYKAPPTDVASYFAELEPGRDYREGDESSMKMVAKFRELVGSVSVLRRPGTDSIRVELKGPIADIDGEVATEVPINHIPLSKRRNFQELARAGKFRLDDADWVAVRAALPFGQVWFGDLPRPLDVRSVLESWICVRKTHLGFSHLPPDVYPDVSYLKPAVMNLSYAGVMDVVQAVLVDRKCEQTAGLELRFSKHRSKIADPIGNFVKRNEVNRKRAMGLLAD